MANLNNINNLIDEIGKAERITKDALRILSRELLEYIVVNDGVEGNNKGSEDSQVANRLIDVLTPVNRKVAIAFLRHFLAFHIKEDEDGKFIAFTGKDKKQWQRKLELVQQFLAEPHNNIWTWADRNVDIVPKPMDFAKLNAAMGQLIKKADKAKLGHGNIIRAMLANGITNDEILLVIKEMADAPAAPVQQAA